MTDLHLCGCRPEPLGSYLSALGVLRLVAGQADPDARGWWEGEHFVLRSKLDREDLLRFLFEAYVPTPVVAPWNKDSKLYDSGRKAPVRLIAESTEARFAAYRSTIEAARLIGSELGPAPGAQAAKRAWKREMVEWLRATLCDDAVVWLDASVVLAGDGLEHPVILGMGGSDGRTEYSSKFMARLVEALGVSRTNRGGGTPRTWLESTLFGGSDCPAVTDSVGQFDGGGAGGVNSAPQGAAASLVNPWRFVLLIEGALCFASAAARRLAAGESRAATPFMVDSSPGGGGGDASGEAAKGELWAPLWSQPATHSELAQVLTEGRAEWRGRQATRGVDVARSAATLGVDRGLSGFTRYRFAARFGRQNLAVPSGRIQVRERTELGVTAQVDPWVEAVRRAAKPPASVVSALRRFDTALLGLAAGGGAARLQGVLGEAAALEVTLGKAASFRAKHRSVLPLRGLKALDWLPALDDATPEFRLAAALASQGDGDPERASLATLLRPVAWDAKEKRLEWRRGGAAVAGFDRRRLCDVLAAAHMRRAIEAARQQEDDSEGRVGVQTAFRHRIPAPTEAVAAFVSGHLDERRVKDLLAGLLLLDWRAGQPDVGHWYRDGTWVQAPDPTWALLAPFFHGRRIRLGDREVLLRPEAEWPAQLASGGTSTVLSAAVRRLRTERLVPVFDNGSGLHVPSGRGPRLAAALLCPLSGSAVGRLLARDLVETE